MLSQSTNLERLLSALEPFDVRWVLVGGMAVIVHGADQFTKDLDMAILFDMENRSKLTQALAPLHPQPLHLAPGADWVWDEKCIRPPWSIFATDAGRIDILIRLPGVEGFEPLWERSEVYSIVGFEVHVASIDDLIAMKSVTERETDARHIAQLQAIKRLRAEQSGATG